MALPKFLAGSGLKSSVTIIFALWVALLILCISFQMRFMASWIKTKPTPEFTNSSRTLKGSKPYQVKSSRWKPIPQKVSNIHIDQNNRRPPIPREDSEIRQVVFAKVHKAASSTLQNIFLRFALERNLSVLLPKRLTSLSEDTRNIFRERVVPHPQGKKFYDILCNHVIFDERVVSKYIPVTAPRIAIIREPLKHSLSALKYYFSSWDRNKAIHKGYNKHPSDPVNGFLQHPEDFYVHHKGASQSFINNRMSVDLGFDLNDFDASKKNQSKIKAFLNKLETQFDVILVSDYFDQSLVLMRRTLRWPMKAITFLKVNVGTAKKISPIWDKKLILTSTVLDKFREWDAIDFQLYDHFLHIFLKRINKEHLFNEELDAFRSIQMDVRHFCVHDTTNETLHIPKSLWTDTFTVSRSDCKLMTMNEPRIVQMMREIQTKRYEEFTMKS